MKKMKGFTLVELIVVIAIIGVLAAILVPAMMGWISKANLRTANSGAKQIYTNAQAIIQDCEEQKYVAATGKGSYFDITDLGFVSTSSHQVKTKSDLAGKSVPIAGVTGTANSTFNDEMIKKLASSKDADWAISVQVLSSSTTDAGTVRAASFGKGTTYIGTFPEVSANKKGAYAAGGVAAACASADLVYSAEAKE